MLEIVKFTLLLAAALLLINQPTDSAHADIADGIFPYPVRIPADGSPYTVTAGSKVLPIEKAGAIEPAYYTRFQIIKPVRVTVKVNSPGKVEFDLRPVRLRKNIEIAASSISFDVSDAGPRVVSVKVDGKDIAPFIVLADDYEPDTQLSSGPGIINVKDYSITSQGLQTTKLQKALDDCAARPDGGVVFFGPGIYRTGSLRVTGKTRLYLASGALIIGSDNLADYMPYKKKDKQLILFDNCSGGGISGFGTIDGNGASLRSKNAGKAHLIDVIGCKSMVFENIVLRDSPAWTMHLLGCENVHVDNIKIIDDWGVANSDGINPDCSSNIKITHCFERTGDDGVAVKTTLRTGINKPTRNVEVKDSVIMSKKTALKVGTESHLDITNITFENIDVVASSRGIGLWSQDGHTFSNIVFRNIRMDLHEIENEAMSGEPIRLFASDRDQSGIMGKINGVLIESISCEAPYRSIFLGDPKSYLENITVRDVTWNLTPRTIKLTDKLPVNELWCIKNSTFSNIKIKWLPEQRSLWSSFMGLTETDKVTVKDSREE